MATMNVLDAEGASTLIEKPNANGRAAAAASRPVVLSTEDKAALDAITAAFGTTEFYQATQPVSGPLTDGQLRATPVPVSGTFWQATQPVSGSVSITGSVAVTGPLTDAQLRATAVPVSGTFWQATQPVSIASLPALATGANIIGAVSINQTTDGTTNKVNIDASLKSGTATRSSVSSGIASATILAANANRKGATIFNSDANALLLDLSGGTAAATRCQVRLTQYQSYEVGSGYTGAITGIWEADGSGIADVVEFT